MKKRAGVLVTVIGDTTLDLVSSILKKLPEEDTEAKVSFTAKLGGQAAHCALGLAKLGVKTRFISCLGKDTWGDSIERRLKKEKNLELKLERKGTTALSVIIPTKHKRTIFNDEGANALFSGRNFSEIKGKYLFIGGFWHLKKLDILRILKAARRKEMVTFLDIGYHFRPDRKKLLSALNQADYCFLDKKELLLYTKERNFFRALKKIPRNCALGLHLGEKGSAFYDGKLVEAAVKRVYPGETTGAGDFWNAAFVYGIMRRWERGKVLKFANQFAVRCLRERGHEL